MKPGPAISIFSITSLSIDEEIYQPIYDEAWKNGYVKYVMPDHDVNVVSLINGYDGEKIKPTGTFKLTIIDDGNYIYDKPKDSESYFAPGNEIKLHSHVIMDAYLAMYVDGEYHSRQTNVETDQGTIWEFTFIMPIGEATLEFKVEGGIW